MDDDTRKLDRSDFPYLLSIPTRWKDNDVYGHVNNVVYYSFFDTAVNTHLIQEGGLNIHDSPVIGVVVETQCEFRKELRFPETIDAGVRVSRVGRTSVTYEIGLFREGDESGAAAVGRFVHVYVDRETRRPSEIPQQIRSAVQALVVEE